MVGEAVRAREAVQTAWDDQEEEDGQVVARGAGPWSAPPRGWMLLIAAMGVVIAFEAGRLGIGISAGAKPLSPTALATLPAEATWPAEATDALRHLPLSFNGRVESVERFARDILVFVTGSPQLGVQDPVQTLFSVVAKPQQWREARMISVKSDAAREAFGFESAQERASFHDVMGEEQIIRLLLPIAWKLDAGLQLSGQERQVLAAYARSAVIAALFDQQLSLAPPAAASHRWMSIVQPDDYLTDEQISLKRTWAAFLSAVRKEQPQEVVEAAQRLGHLLCRFRDRSSPELPRGLVYTPFVPKLQ